MQTPSCRANVHAKKNRQIVFAGIVAALVSGSVCAQVRDFPSRAVRLIVPNAPGGLVDIVARSLAQKLTEVMGQTIVIENRPGASTNIGTELAARAPADGYTLLANTLPLVINPSLFPKLPFNVEKDLAPVSMLVSSPYIIATHPSVPVQSIKELIALAKARPGVLNYSSGGSGTGIHAAVELFKNTTGIQMTHISYKGGGPALASLVAGETDLSIPSLAAVLPQVKAARVRALAVTGNKRSALLPQLPTVVEAGVSHYEFTSWTGVLVPAATPTAIVTTLHGYIVKAMRAPEVAARFAREGTDIVANSPSEFGALIKTELVRWPKIVRDSGMRAD